MQTPQTNLQTKKTNKLNLKKVEFLYKLCSHKLSPPLQLTLAKVYRDHAFLLHNTSWNGKPRTSEAAVLVDQLRALKRRFPSVAPHVENPLLSAELLRTAKSPREYAALVAAEHDMEPWVSERYCDY